MGELLKKCYYARQNVNSNTYLLSQYNQLSWDKLGKAQNLYFISTNHTISGLTRDEECGGRKEEKYTCGKFGRCTVKYDPKRSIKEKQRCKLGFLFVGEIRYKDNIGLDS